MANAFPHKKIQSLFLQLLLKVAEHSFRARALANAIQRAHKDGKKQTCRRYGDHFICSMPALSVLFFFIIERSVLRVLVFYYKGLLEKVTIQRTQQFSAFSLLPEEPISNICRLNNQKTKFCVVNLLAASFGDQRIKGFREKGE